MKLEESIDTKAQRGLFRWVWNTYLKRHWKTLAIAFAMMSIEGSMLGLIAYVMKPMFDDVFIGGDMSSLYWVGTVIFVIFLARAITNVAKRILITRVASRVIFRIQSDLLKHLMRLESLFHNANPPGALMDRIGGDTGAIRTIANTLIIGMGRDVISLIALMSVVLYIDWKWTLIALIGTPVLVLPTMLVQQFIRRTSRAKRIVAGQISVRLNEVFHGINPIKLNALETYQSRRFGSLADERVRLEVRQAIGKSAIPAMIDIMTGVGFFAVLLFAGTEIISGDKTVGEFMAFFTAMALAFEPLRRLGALSGLWQATAVSLDRLKRLFDVKPGLTSPKNPLPLPGADGDIQLSDVQLSYGDLPVLQGTTFTAKAGKTTALVGASGAGKSTVFNVLTRLVDINGGAVTLGSTDIRQVDLKALRSQFSVVTQDSLLFDESIRDNILLDRTDVSETQLQKVLEAAHIADFVASLPEGLDSPAGPRGSNLSGGQRQRVAIARALLRDTPILLLDEATSALDTRSETVVQAALERLSEGRTTLVIAHRLSTIRNADKIVVMAQGLVVEEGTHDELLAADGAYAELYQLQFSKLEEDELESLPA